MRALVVCSVLTMVACSSNGASGDTDRAVAPDVAFADAPDAVDEAPADDVAEPPIDATDTPDVEIVSDAPVDAGPPLVAPSSTWTWVPIDEMKCADGSSTGVGVNLVPGADRTLIFLQGGGACWDAATCWGPIATSLYLTGYGRLAFDTDPQRPTMLALRRDDPNNPFNRMNIVYVPYCTGDVHSGDRVVSLSYGGVSHITRFVGAHNLDVVFARVRATTPHLDRVYLAGDSAGGFGAAINFGRAQRAFGDVRVDVVDDSGQPIAPDPARWAAWRSAWNLQLPADCATCADHIDAFVDYYAARFPTHRFGLISFTNDTVITTFMNLRPDQFSTELQALGDHVDHAWPGARYYFIPGLSHVGMVTPTPGLIDWLHKMVADDPAWSSHR